MDVNELTFGVEVECAVDGDKLAEAGWYVSQYHGGTGQETNGEFPGWKVERDSSVGADVPFDAGMRPIEVISPVLRGREGLDEMTRVAARLRELGGKVNSTCGFHVHVGFPTVSLRSDAWSVPQQTPEIRPLVRLVYLTASHETALFASTGTPTRHLSRYTKPIRHDYHRAAQGTVDTITGLKRKFTPNREQHDRFHVLNLRNILADTDCNGRLRKPTVEFRVFAGTVNGTKMRGYVQLCLGLVQYAVEEGRKVRWTPLPNVWLPRVLPNAGTGEIALHQLFARLGWERSYSRHLNPKRGVLDPEGLTAAMHLLLQLARKYDGGPRRARIDMSDLAGSVAVTTPDSAATGDVDEAEG